MNKEMLSKILLSKGLGQREFARKLGYSSPGLVSMVLKGKASIPQDDIPKWADALNLDGKERSDFIEWASVSAIPDWLRAELAALRQEVRLRDDILGTGFPIEVSDADIRLCGGDEAKAKRLALWRRAQQFTWERIAEAEGRKRRPTVNDREIQR